MRVMMALCEYWLSQAVQWLAGLGIPYYTA